jgi:hypothetical protein
METYRIILVGITAALGFVALGLGGFLLSPAVSSLHSPAHQERTRGRQPRVAEKG